MRARPKIRKRIETPAFCSFCKEEKEPSYKDYKKLLDFLTVRGAIKPKKYSGLCSAHQRSLGREVKRARHLGLLPFLAAS